MKEIRMGVIGAGKNTCSRHIPGFQDIPGVEIAGVVNRTAESSNRVAREFSIANTYDHWEQLIKDPEIDAVCIGTWPYLHCPITLAALEAGKHVLTEARMAMNAEEAHRMYDASLRYPNLTCQIVPSPFGFKVDRVVKDLVTDGYLGELRELVVLGADDSLLDDSSPMHWRNDTELSGLNMLTLGIMHETVMRWSPQPCRVMAQSHIFTPERKHLETGRPHPVSTPESVQVITELENGGRGIYHFSGVTLGGPGWQIHLYGTQGTLKYQMSPQEKLLGMRRGEDSFSEIKIPLEKEYAWRVEEEFIGAIRGEEVVQFTDFETGVRYMEFTQAVAKSAETRRAMDLTIIRGD